MLPLITTISSFMIITFDKETTHVTDPAHFIHEKDEDVYKMRTIRNACLDLISMLVDVFGDEAVYSILTVVGTLFLNTKSPVSPQKQSTSNSASTVAQGSVEDINIFDFSYNSTNKKHFWKKREVALYIVGSFWQDIQNYRVRHPDFNLQELVENLFQTDFKKALLRSYLKGRSLWCAI